MDMLLTATAATLVRRGMTAGCHAATPADEDAYYTRQTVNLAVPAWISGLVAWLRRDRNAPHYVRAARHA